MNAVTIDIQIPPETQAFIQRLDPARAMAAVKRGVDRATPLVVKRIVINRLSGTGPFPPSEHRLGRRTGTLQQSLRAEPAVISGSTVTAAIGSPVVYARVHEFGAVITPKQSKSLVFSIGDKKIFAKKVEIPARAPVTTGVEENLDLVRDEIGKELEATLNA